MGISNFIIVLGFNLYWVKDGLEDYKGIYTGEYDKWFSACAWLFALWGISNLIYSFL